MYNVIEGNKIIHFMEVVKNLLKDIGYGDVSLADSWIDLFNEGLSPLEAVLVSEFDFEGKAAIGWGKFIIPAKEAAGYYNKNQ